MNSTSTYFISAGEVSGDLLAADLMAALKRQLGNSYAFGNAGDAMIQEGAEAVFHIRDLSTMGFTDVIHKLPEFGTMEKTLLEQIDRKSPDFAVLVDFPGLHIRLAEQLKLRGIPVFQYVAPKTWAWGEHRNRRLKKHFNLILGIFPFEAEYFAAHGVPFEYVGTPHLNRMDSISQKRPELGWNSEDVVMVMMPGSRHSEFIMIFKEMWHAFQKLKQSIPNLKAALPIAPGISVQEVISWIDVLDLGLSWQLRESPTSNKYDPVATLAGEIDLYQGMNLELMASADLGLITSGTASFEAALLELPHVVVYRTSEQSYRYIHKRIKSKYISLPNILAQRLLVREFIQHWDTEELSSELKELVGDRGKRSSQLKSFRNLRDSLSSGASDKAAQIIVHHVLGASSGSQRCAT